MKINPIKAILTSLTASIAILGAGCASTPDKVGADTNALYYWGKHYYYAPQGTRIRCRSRQLTVFTPSGEALTGAAGVDHLADQAGSPVGADAIDGQPVITLRRRHCGHARGRYGRLPLLVNGGLGVGPGRVNVRTQVGPGRVNTGVRVNTQTPRL